MNYGQVEAGEGVLPSRTVRGRKPSIERHKDVLERVLEGNTPSPAPLRSDEEHYDWELVEISRKDKNYLQI